MDSLAPSSDGALLQPRNYQLEMLTDSLKRNIIVAMDTGSGKTQVAVLRIAVELERCSPGKLVWFLVPTKTLAEQQYGVVCGQLASVQCRLLTGSDGVDRWSDQWIWDDVLQDIRVVVSTHQVLLDALVHGFIRMARLALLVFDEAHSCVSDHPSNRIMRDFYHPSLQAGESQIPHILGLTASPVFNNKIDGLRNIEQNMNSISRTPKLHREQLLQYVHRPSMKAIIYPQVGITQYSSAIQSLKELFEDMDIEDDPYVLKLRLAGHDRDSKQLQKVLLSRRTYCQDHVKRFLRMALNVHAELGSWAANFYVESCIRRFQSGSFPDTVNFDTLEETEKNYLQRLFSKIHCHEVNDSRIWDESELTPKVHRLIDTLVREMNDRLTGLVFVETRASAAVLVQLLSIHPCTREIVNASSFVGTSNVAQRKSTIGELMDGDQATTLDDLRSGKKNLVVATSVLEEGIDVSICNLVICFAKPPNLKSFIQRRGRARHIESTYILMFEEKKGSAEAGEWLDLEEKMKETYMDDMRTLEALQVSEATDEGSREFVVKSTGAKLTLNDGVQHLNHFCSTLSARKFVDLNPLFTFEGDAKVGILATVTLPTSIESSLRQFSSSQLWRSQINARRDAAFEAYIALYRAGLVNDNLLPLLSHDEAEVSSAVEKRPSLVICAEQFNPWSKIAIAWLSEPVIHEYRVRLCSYEKDVLQMMLFAPCALPPIPSMDLYWDTEQRYTVDISYEYQRAYDEPKVAGLLQSTHCILRSIYAGRMESSHCTLPLLFAPVQYTDGLAEWLQSVEGRCRIDTMFESVRPNNEIGLVRDMSNNGLAHIFHAFEYRRELLEPSIGTGFGNNMSEQHLHVDVTRLPKRSDFLHKIHQDVASPKIRAGHAFLPAETCEMDRLPYIYSQFAMFFPCITHHIEVSLVATHLCENLLSPVKFQNRNLVMTAISASVAREPSNYQRLEFLGDGILKFLTSINLMSRYLNWHEGYLSKKKDHIVSNSNLAKVAQQTGLDKYILTKPFTGHKWRPMYNHEILEAQHSRNRELSTKVLADVVEALIGAAYLDGGYCNALICLSTFLPKVDWLAFSQYHEILAKEAASTTVHFPKHFTQLEDLIGYTFDSKPLLLEALTYPSYVGLNSSQSYERLEFFGDSILDFIITTKIFNHQPDLPHQTMHLIRSCLANANFLAFHCMSLSLPLIRTEVVEDKTDRSFSTIETSIPRYIWQFMRHSQLAELVLAQQSCLSRFHSLRSAIQDALSTGRSYPWTLLSMFDAEKFFSDLIESLLGAIYIDTFGSIPSCEAFLTTLGIMGYLERVLCETVHLMHPKEKLGIVAGEKKVKYENQFHEEGLEGEKWGWACKVWIGEREICVAEQGRNRMEAETRGAEEAVRILNEEREKISREGDLEMEEDEDEDEDKEFFDAQDTL